MARIYIADIPNLVVQIMITILWWFGYLGNERKNSNGGLFNTNECDGACLAHSYLK
jgi:hypothetical protein